MRSRFVFSASAAAVLALAWYTPGQAQTWTAEIFHPPGTSESWLYGIADGQVVGAVFLPGGVGAAYVWTLDGIPTRLDGPGMTNVEVYGVSQGRHVGSATVDGVDMAVMWSGTPESVVDLEFPAAFRPLATTIHKNVIGGYLFDPPNIYRAVAGTQQTGWEDLGNGTLYDTDGRRHVGHQKVGFDMFPVIWTGSRPIRLDIGVSVMPSDTSVSGIHDEEQVGTWLENLANQKAVIWYGSGESYEFLSQASYTQASDVYAGQQVGTLNANRAMRWVHRAGVQTSLQASLPSKYTASEAYSVWDDAEAFTYISGTAWMNSTRHAVVWKSNNIDTSNVTAMNVLPGIVVAGNLQSIQNSEDDRLVLRPGIVFASGQPPIVVYAEGTAAVQNPLRISVSVESQASAPVIVQLVEFFDFMSQAYVPRNEDRLLLSDDVYRYDQVRNVSRFVEPGTGKMRAKISYPASGPVFLFPWQVRIDRIWWHQLIS